MTTKSEAAVKLAEAVALVIILDEVTINDAPFKLLIDRYKAYSSASPDEGELRKLFQEVLNDLDRFKTCISNLEAANKTIVADWAHGPFKELDLLVGTSVYLLRHIYEDVEALALKGATQ